MGTRLWLEQTVKARFPHFRYVRVRTSGKHQGTIYAWDNDLRLLETDAAALRRYASGGLSSYIRFGVKPYEDVPKECGPEPAVPDDLRQAALQGELNQERIFALLGSLHPGIGVAFDRYDPATGLVHIHVYGHSVITDQDKQKLERYTEELIPVGSTARLVYYE
ncbi:hypothetical protein [Paenibacillus protaetiae]|uniref:Uncharacterized protein n=1 Tax=Paenibacillus protaetiae TaxID=2509456 RepID=A0A4P6F462_9BACL|nr:hypothetical protein [Paenibacillus protaetiae]QAY67957.1 hypothetical protein ET464_17790 [Paenibacillus protaetiae]